MFLSITTNSDSRFLSPDSGFPETEGYIMNKQYDMIEYHCLGTQNEEARMILIPFKINKVLFLLIL